VSEGTRHDYPVGRCAEVPASAPPRRWQKAVDMAVARLARRRPFGQRAYVPHTSAINRDFDGPILIHNNPVALPLFKRRFPRALIGLWANNELWRTYSARETDRIATAADRLICCSHYIADRTRERLAAKWHNKIRVVHNGVDIARFRPAERRPADPPVILFIGRVVEQKGPHLLLEAAAKLGPNVSPFRVRIVGSSGFTAEGGLSPYERHLRELAEPLGDRAEFVPFRDRGAVLDEYANGSIFCVPSNWDDPCPLTVLEGMACSLAIVASRRGGIPEEVGEAALLFDPPDTDAFARQLRRLLDSPDEREGFAQAARRQAERFAWEHQHRALLDALKD
jgi:glycosyltransferase involved in cell wall biosynthesis